jgi:hypothetical protein
MQIDVQSRTTREGQDNLAVPINTFLIPKLGIKDWILTFEKTDPKDDLRDARTQQIKFQTAFIAASAGFNVKLDDFGDLEISGEATLGGGLTGDASTPSSVAGLVPNAPRQSSPNERLPEENAGLELSDQTSRHDGAVHSSIRTREAEDAGLWTIQPSMMARMRETVARLAKRRRDDPASQEIGS